jgi:hypothetical protein
MSRTYANGGKARLQLPVCAFTPSDFFEGAEGGLIANSFTETGRWSVVRCNSRGGRPISLGLGWQRLFARLPDRHRALDADHILQVESGNAVANSVLIP